MDRLPIHAPAKLWGYDTRFYYSGVSLPDGIPL